MTTKHTHPPPPREEKEIEAPPTKPFRVVKPTPKPHEVDSHGRQVDIHGRRLDVEVK